MTKFNLSQFDTNRLGLGDIRSIILDFFLELQESGYHKQIHPSTIIQAANNALMQYKDDNKEPGITLYQCQYCKKLYRDNRNCSNCCTINSMLVVSDDKTEVWTWDHNSENWEYDLTL